MAGGESLGGGPAPLCSSGTARKFRSALVPSGADLKQGFPLRPLWFPAHPIHGGALLPMVDGPNSHPQGPRGLSHSPYTEWPPCGQPLCFTSGPLVHPGELLLFTC